MVANWASTYTFDVNSLLLPGVSDEMKIRAPAMLMLSGVSLYMIYCELDIPSGKAGTGRRTTGYTPYVPRFSTTETFTLQKLLTNMFHFSGFILYCKPWDVPRCFVVHLHEHLDVYDTPYGKWDALILFHVGLVPHPMYMHIDGRSTCLWLVQHTAAVHTGMIHMDEERISTPY